MRTTSHPYMPTCTSIQIHMYPHSMNTPTHSPTRTHIHTHTHLHKHQHTTADMQAHRLLWSRARQAVLVMRYQFAAGRSSHPCHNHIHPHTNKKKHIQTGTSKLFDVPQVFLCQKHHTPSALVPLPPPSPHAHVRTGTTISPVMPYPRAHGITCAAVCTLPCAPTCQSAVGRPTTTRAPPSRLDMPEWVARCVHVSGHEEGCPWVGTRKCDTGTHSAVCGGAKAGRNGDSQRAEGQGLEGRPQAAGAGASQQCLVGMGTGRVMSEVCTASKRSRV